MTTYYREPPFFLKEELWKIANYLMSPGKGILAMDQTDIGYYFGNKLFWDVPIENSEDSRRRFRELVVTTEDELANYISGIIFPVEAFGDLIPPNGESIVQVLKKKGIVSGVTLDLGHSPLIGTDGECTTAGLNDLDDICQNYKNVECHFAKWRSVYRVGENLPSTLAINNNAETMARFASICQYNRLVPIIEPDILPEGKYSLTRAQQITETVLAALFKSLNNHHIYLEGLILKINFVTPGMQRKVVVRTADVALATITTLNRTVPPAVMGIIFLAGSASEEDATSYLDAINQPIARHPWPISFSFGRGMLSSVLRIWRGDDENIENARKKLLERAKLNSYAASGRYEYELRKIKRKEKKERDREMALERFISNQKKLRTHRFEDETVDEID